MKKTILALLGVALIAVPACKKGENDPFLSLKSRKARLAGGYVVSKMESTEKIMDEYSETTTTKTFDGTTLFEKIIYSNSASPVSVSYPVTTAEWVFKKDGTWEMAWSYKKTVVTEDDYSKTTTVTDYIKTQSGIWAFVGKTKKQYKNKERVQLSVLSEDISTNDDVQYLDKSTGISTPSKSKDILSATYLSGEYTIIYDIDMLKNKEMIFKRVYSKDYVSQYDDGTSTPYDIVDKTSLDETITLTQIKK